MNGESILKPLCLVCEKPLRKIKENEKYDWQHKVHKGCYRVYCFMKAEHPNFYGGVTTPPTPL